MSTATRSFNWQGGLSEAERASVQYAEPGTMLADGDWYLDATSPKRGPVLAMDGEKVPAGGLYILKSQAGDELFARLQAAAAGK